MEFRVERIARISGGQNEEDLGLLLRSYPNQAGILFLTNMEPHILFQTNMEPQTGPFQKDSSLHKAFFGAPGLGSMLLLKYTP